MPIRSAPSRTAAILACVLLLPRDPASAQRKESPKLELFIDSIMRGPALYGTAPSAVRWSADSQRVFFRWKRYDEPLNKDASTYVVSRDGSGMRKLSDEEEKDAAPVAAEQTRDGKLAVFASEGDLFLYDRAAGKRHRLTDTSDVESSPRFTQDEKRVTYIRN